MDAPITRAEHEEFRKRIEAENSRQNKRLDLLDENVRQIGALTISMEKMACNMENMFEEQKDQGDRLTKQGERLEKLEQQPADRWNSMMRTLFTSICSTVGGGLAVGLILLIAQNI